MLPANSRSELVIVPQGFSYVIIFFCTAEGNRVLHTTGWCIRDLLCSGDVGMVVGSWSLGSRWSAAKNTPHVPIYSVSCALVTDGSKTSSSILVGWDDICFAIHRKLSMAW